MKQTVIIAHYDEIGIKGRNRTDFEKILIQNMEDKIRAHGLKGSVRRIFGRLQVTPEDFGPTTQPTWKKILETTFGIAYFYFGKKVDADFEVLKTTLLDEAQQMDFESFRVTAKRSDKAFPMNSGEIARTMGGEILKFFSAQQMPKKVSMKDFEVNFQIHIAGKKAFIFSEKIPGPGGLPIRSSGKCMVLISGGIDSPVAAHYAMKRGLKPTFIHFHSYPQTSQNSLEKVRELTRALTPFSPELDLYMIPFLEVQKKILFHTPDKFRILLYRRFMMRIAEKIAHKINAKVLITGENLGQVASQTIENIAVVENAVDLPILRPLACFDKKEIITDAKRIGTFEISIRPHDDCCTVYMPKDPETKGKLQDIFEQEALLEEKFGIEKIIEETIGSLEIEKIKSTNNVLG